MTINCKTMQSVKILFFGNEAYFINQVFQYLFVYLFFFFCEVSDHNILQTLLHNKSVRHQQLKTIYQSSLEEKVIFNWKSDNTYYFGICTNISINKFLSTKNYTSLCSHCQQQNNEGLCWSLDMLDLTKRKDASFSKEHSQTYIN